MDVLNELGDSCTKVKFREETPLQSAGLRLLKSSRVRVVALFCVPSSAKPKEASESIILFYGSFCFVKITRTLSSSRSAVFKP